VTRAFTIRLAEISDAEPLSGFVAHVFRTTYSSSTAASDLDAYIRKNFAPEVQAAEIADPESATFLAIADGAIVGYTHMTVETQTSARLNRIYIDAAWQGSGLANALVDAVVKTSKQRGASRLGLTVFEQNPRAIAFYRRVGFVTTGQTIFVVGDDPQTDLLMELNLDEF
jgi:diamine N-acetyltransferase